MLGNEWHLRLNWYVKVVAHYRPIKFVVWFRSLVRRWVLSVSRLMEGGSLLTTTSCISLPQLFSYTCAMVVKGEMHQMDDPMAVHLAVLSSNIQWLVLFTIAVRYPIYASTFLGTQYRSHGLPHGGISSNSRLQQVRIRNYSATTPGIDRSCFRYQLPPIHIQGSHALIEGEFKH